MKKMRKLLMSTVLAMACSACMVPASAAELCPAGGPADFLSRPGFTITAKGVKYLQPDGTFLKDSWLFIGSQAWCFDSEGYMVTGQRNVDSHLWFLTFDGNFALMDNTKPAFSSGSSAIRSTAAAPAATATPAADAVKSAPANAGSKAQKPSAALSPSEAPAAAPSAVLSPSEIPAAAPSALSANTVTAPPERGYKIPVFQKNSGSTARNTNLKAKEETPAAVSDNSAGETAGVSGATGVSGNSATASGNAMT